MRKKLHAVWNGVGDEEEADVLDEYEEENKSNFDANGDADDEIHSSDSLTELSSNERRNRR